MRTHPRSVAAVAAAAAAVVALLCCARASSAQVQLVVVNPTTSGVAAAANTPLFFSPDSATPTQATATRETVFAFQTATATLDDTPDAVRQFTFNTALTVPQATTNAGQGYGAGAGTSSTGGTFDPVTFQVVGVGGYTGPVTVSLTSVYQGSTSGAGTFAQAIQQVNGQNVAVPAGASGPTLFTFNVGDTFTYRAEVLGTVVASSTGARFATQQLTTTLTASAATPAPPGLVVAGIGGLMGLVSFRRRRRKAAE